MPTINSIDSNIPIELSKGGTNAASMTTNTGIIKYDGTRLVTSSTALIDASNRYTNSSQPIFFAVVSATVNNVTGNNAAYTVICGSEKIDQGGNYNAGTGVFTAPVTGRYYLTATILLSNVTAANNNCASGIITPSQELRNSCNPGAIANTVAGGLSPILISSVVSMTAGDTAYITTNVTGGAGKTVGILGDAGTGQTYFSGYLVC